MFLCPAGTLSSLSFHSSTWTRKCAALSIDAENDPSIASWLEPDPSIANALVFSISFITLLQSSWYYFLSVRCALTCFSLHPSPYSSPHKSSIILRKNHKSASFSVGPIQLFSSLRAIQKCTCCQYGWWTDQSSLANAIANAKNSDMLIVLCTYQKLSWASMLRQWPKILLVLVVFGAALLTFAQQRLFYMPQFASFWCVLGTYLSYWSFCHHSFSRLAKLGDGDSKISSFWQKTVCSCKPSDLSFPCFSHIATVQTAFAQKHVAANPSSCSISKLLTFKNKKSKTESFFPALANCLRQCSLSGTACQRLWTTKTLPGTPFSCSGPRRFCWYLFSCAF